MKALSIQQPWAWLIANGYKDIENRTWPTNHRGRIYIHAAAKVDQWAIPIRDRRLFGGPENGALISREVTARMMYEAIYPNGKIWKQSAIIGEVDIVDCIQRAIVEAIIPDYRYQGRRIPWFDGPYGFVLANPVLYDKAIPYKGRLGFFEVML